MTDRKKKGIAAIIGGSVAIGIGVVLVAFTQTPDWVPIILQLVGAIADVFGFKLVYPDSDG